MLPDFIIEPASSLRPSHLPEIALQCPTDLAEVFEHMHQGASLIAGGTDILLVAAQRGAPHHLVWTGGVEALKEVEESGETIRIGAATPLAQLIRSQSFRHKAPAVADGAQLVGSVQLRNQATIVGNVCTASPAADTVPGLLVHDCVVETADRKNNTRRIDLKNFMIGPGKTALRDGELVTGLTLTRLGKNQTSAYQRFTQRAALDLAFASVAVKLDFDQDGVALKSVMLVLGAVGETAIDASSAADGLIGYPLSEDRLSQCADAASQMCEPISDQRASAGYRHQLIRALVVDVIKQAAARYGERS